MPNNSNIYFSFSGDFGDRYSRQLKNLKNQDYKETTVNGYAPYFEYALDYSPPSANNGKVSLAANNKTTSSSNINSATLPHYTNPASTTSNMSLPRNRPDLQQSQVPTQMGNGFMGKFVLRYQ